MLLERHFTSVSQLEVLVLLVRNPRWWTVAEVTAELGLNADHVRHLLGSLVRARLVDGREGGYRFRGTKTTRGAAAEDLAHLYDRYRVRLMNIIFAKPSGQIRDFADAFRLRPGGDELEEDGDG